MRAGSLNVMIALGRLTRDWDAKSVGPNKYTLAKNTIALNTHVRSADGEDKVETCYLEVEAWQHVGENLLRFSSKGDLIVLRGRLRLNQWTDRSSGAKLQKITLYVESFENLKVGNGGNDNADTDSESLLPHGAENQGVGRA